VNIITFDVETTHTSKPNGDTTPLPYFGNRLVSIGYKELKTDVVYDCYYHSTEPPSWEAFSYFQGALDDCDVLIGHNIKFDLQWIRACGFVYEGDIYDTMVAEYILSKGQSQPLGLAAVAGKYGGVQKEKDLVKPYLDAGQTFYDIPWDIIEEYGQADVLATEHVALAQLKEFETTFEELYGVKDSRPNIEAVA
jgi:DNA polymerase I-like protein with 3'-5' exonuclease and polymerase domains|tara:strand:- start:5266 stop:5847 length:582 start_codon:yes stop_codon:yes gene_type:complete